MKKYTQKNTEHGAVMLLLILLLVPMLIAVAMAIDSARFTTSDTELERIANSMALGALETFLLMEQPADFSAREAAAKERAVELANLESNSLIAAHDNNFSVDDFRPNGNAQITFGRWFFEEPGNGCENFQSTAGQTCPCSGATFTGPCFVPSADPFEINSARLAIQTESNIVNSIFGSLLDLSALRLNASSTVAAVPRNGVFLVDLSRSTQFQTHLPLEQLSAANQNQASEFAFRLAADVNTGTQIFTCNDIVPGGNTCNANGLAKLANYCTNTFPGASQTVLDTCNTQCPPITPFVAHQTWHTQMQQSGSDPSPTAHYRNNYRCETLTNPANSAQSEAYLIEQDQTGKEPEPLNTILGGIYQAMQTLRQRSIAGDTITLIGFDGAVFDFTNPPIRSFGPARIDLREGSLFRQIEDLTNPDRSFNEKIPAFFFPGSGPNRGETDIAGALIAARDRLLEQNNFNIARNFVVLFSDGLASCFHGPTATNGCMFTGASLSPTQCLSPAPTNVRSTHSYNNSYTVHLLGLKEATQVISRLDGIPGTIDPTNNHSLPSATQSSCGGASNQLSYFELGIRFHYFAIGNNVRPFSWSQANAAKTDCATEEQLLDAPMDPTPLENQTGLFFKLAHANCNSNMLTPSEQAACNNTNSFYGLSHQMFANYGTYQTRGIYAPVRPPCTPPSGQTLVDMMQTFTNNCAAATQSYEPVSHGDPYTITESTRQMLVCDPKGRDAATQILENIQTVYGENPFVIVE